MSLVFKIYRQNRLQFANLLANLVRNFITNFYNLMRNFRIWLAGFQSTWWSRVYSSQISNQPRNWHGQSFVKSTVKMRCTVVQKQALSLQCCHSNIPADVRGGGLNLIWSRVFCITNLFKNRQYSSRNPNALSKFAWAWVNEKNCKYLSHWIIYK
jgi:hypothetical protein